MRRTATHWGAYEVDTAHGRVTSLRAPSDDPEPSPIGPGMPDALVGPLRITQPMARCSWLEHGPAERDRPRPAATRARVRSATVSAVTVARV